MILSATDSTGLDTWLRREKYNIPQGAAEALAPYIARQVEVLRRQGRHQEGQARRAGRRAAVAAALPLRRQRAAPAGAPRPAQRGRQAGPDRLRHPPDVALRGRELRQRRSSRPTSRSPTACATTSRRSTPSCSTRPSRRSGARSSSPSTPGRRRRAIRARRRRSTGNELGDAGRRRARAATASCTAPSWVLTRLHTRYSKETLAEDLIFREAKPAMGGRANWNGTNGDEGATVARRTAASTTSRGATSSATTGTGRSPARSRHTTSWGGPPGNPDAPPDADRGEGAGDRAAREGGAQGPRCARRCRCSASPASRRSDGRTTP